MFPFPGNLVLGWDPEWPWSDVELNVELSGYSAVPPHQGVAGQFCGGDTQLHQQAQSQAQTQAQISALQQQNTLLNQQLASQTVSHIHHLQQLLPQQAPNLQQQAPTTGPWSSWTTNTQ